MNSKSLLIIVISFFLFGCGYTPMFSSNSKTRINIENLDISGDRELNNFVKEKIERLNDEDSDKTISITAKTNYSKETQIKDKSGNTTQYKLKANISYIIETDKTTIEFSSKVSSSMNNFSDEFEQKNYELATKDQFSVIFVNKLIVNLSRIE